MAAQSDTPKLGDRARVKGKGNRTGGEMPASSEELVNRGKDSAADQTGFVGLSNEYRKTKPNKAKVGGK